VKTQFKEIFPGLALSGLIGVIAYIAWWVTKQTLLISPLLWAFVLSIILGNLGLVSLRMLSGIRFASSRMLRVSVGALGIVVSASAWWRLGSAGLCVVLLNLILTLALGYIVCRVVLKLNIKQAILITTGTAICGASAIAATSPAIEANEEDTALALAVVTLFGLIAMFLYPALFKMTTLGDWLHNDPLAFGLWNGVGIHETAQVIASASQVEGALDIATLAKSIRIFMIGPVVLLTALYFRRTEGINRTGGQRISWPWFAAVFVALTFVHAGLENWIGEDWLVFAKKGLSPLIKFFLTWAFAAVGLRVRFSPAGAGASALLLTILLWL